MYKCVTTYGVINFANNVANNVASKERLGLLQERDHPTLPLGWAGGRGGGVGVGMENSGGVLTFSCVFSPAEISREYLTPSLYLTMNSPPQQRKN